MSKIFTKKNVRCYLFIIFLNVIFYSITRQNQQIFQKLYCIVYLNICRFRFKHVLDEQDIARNNLINCSDNLCHKNVTFSIHAHRKALQ